MYNNSYSVNLNYNLQYIYKFVKLGVEILTTKYASWMIQDSLQKRKKIRTCVTRYTELSIIFFRDVVTFIPRLNHQKKAFYWDLFIEYYDSALGKQGLVMFPRLMKTMFALLRRGGRNY